MGTNWSKQNRQFLKSPINWFKKNESPNTPIPESWQSTREQKDFEYIASQGTMVSIPALQSTDAIPGLSSKVVPIGERMVQRCQWINSYIHAMIGDVLFTKDGCEYLVKRIVRFEQTEFYLVIYEDYNRHEGRHFMYRFNDIRIPMGGY